MAPLASDDVRCVVHREHGWSRLESLIEIGESDGARLLVKTATPADRNRALLFAAEHNLALGFWWIDMLIKAGAAVDAYREYTGWQVIHTLCNRTERDFVESAIALGASIDARTLDGDTPMHIAVRSGRQDRSREVVSLLLARGADINARNNSGQTPLASVRPIRDFSFHRFLKQRGAHL